jgi:putative two-component system response regulator
MTNLRDTMFEEINIENSKIVIIDDSKTTVQVIKDILINKMNFNFQVFEAFDGIEGLELIKKICPDAVLLDIDMPRMNGLELCKILRNDESTQLTPIVIITGSDTVENKIIALKSGANDFISKTRVQNLDIVDIQLKIESLLKIKRLTDNLEKAENIIKSLAKAVEYKDYYTKGHADRVSNFGEIIAKKMHLDQELINDITLSGLLHDIGKIGVPDNILNKPDKLSAVEFEIIKRHPLIGEEICLPIKSFEKVREIIRHHHEKLNGTGYPDGLKGTEISLGSRIIAVADIYDALTSRRSYRNQISHENSIKILKESALKNEIDKEVVDVFLGYFEKS